jgi:hypothetical protein
MRQKRIERGRIDDVRDPQCAARATRKPMLRAASEEQRAA